MIVEVVPGALDGERLDRVVAMALGVTRRVAAQVVADGGASIDGEVCTSGKTRLVEGQQLRIDPATVAVEEPPRPDESVPFEVVYADADLVVVDKPAGVVVHPGAGNPDGTLVNGLLAAFPEIAEVGEPFRPGIVHRLDAGTSGLMLVARSAAAYVALVEMMSAHEVTRVYRCVVWGHLDHLRGVIDAPIGRHRRDPQRMAATADGRDARTHFEVVEAYSSPVSASLVRCQLETGRTHQIRVHLSTIGHPVVGDATYGGARQGLTAERPMLHSAHLALVHPVSGEHLSFVSPDPADMRALLATLDGERG